MISLLQPAPAILFVFNRPHLTERSLAGLARNTIATATPLYIISDGPRGRADRRAVDAVRKIARAEVLAQRFANVTLIEAEENNGLRRAIINGVDLVMRQHGEAIVLEDDLVAAPDFLYYMNACLRYYQRDTKIGSISGYSPLKSLPVGVKGDVYALPRNGSHGWATWSDRWGAVDWTLKGYDTFRTDRAARRRFDRAGSDRSRRLDREVAGRANSWSIRFGFWQDQAEKLTVYPRDNRIINLGGDGSGVHGAKGFKFNTMELEDPKPFKLAPVREDQRVVDAAARLYGGGPARRFVRRLAAEAGSIRARFGAPLHRSEAGFY
ncbi:MAG: sugar transferase [Pseudomonadota bacterium]